MPEFIDPVFVKISPKRSFSITENEHFGLVFTKTESINSGTCNWLRECWWPFRVNNQSLLVNYSSVLKAFLPLWSYPVVKCHPAAYWDSWYFHLYLNKGLKFSVLVHNVLGSRSGIMFPDPVHNPCSQIHSLCLGGLLTAGRYGNPVPELTLSPSQGLWIWLLNPIRP